nr:hypothetical protein [uncultured Allomuricauda sp.]
MIGLLITIALLLVANLYYLVKKDLKWKYYKDGIQIMNKKGEVVLEYDKPLKK